MTRRLAALTALATSVSAVLCAYAGPLPASFSARANMMVQVKRDGQASAPFPLLDLSNGPALRDGRVVSPALDAFLRAIDPSRPMPRGSVVVKDESILARLNLGPDSAEVYADLRAPEKGGMIRFRFESASDGLAGRSKGYFMARALYNLGFSVNTAGGAVTGLVDEDHQALSAGVMARGLSGALRAFQSLPDFEKSVPALLRDALGQDDASRRIDAVVRTLIPDETDASEHGALPPSTHAAFVVAGISAGVQKGVPLEERVTYDPAKAARDGLIFVTPYAEDVSIFSKVRAVVFTSGGADSLTALAARKAGIPAIYVGSAEWTPASGVRLSSGGRALLLREGTILRLDPASGTLTASARAAASSL